MDPATFALLIQLGTAAIQGGGELYSWWTKVHAATLQEVRLTPDQAKQLDDLVASRRTDPNWQPDANA